MAAPSATASSGFCDVFNRGPAGAVIVGAQAHIAARFLEFGAAKHFRHHPPHQRHARLPADQDDLIQVRGLKLGVG